MTEREQQIALAKDIEAIVERYSMEFEMTYVSMIGVLELQKLDLVDFLFNGGEGDQEEEWASE